MSGTELSALHVIILFNVDSGPEEVNIILTVLQMRKLGFQGYSDSPGSHRRLSQNSSPGLSVPPSPCSWHHFLTPPPTRRDGP